MLKIGVTGGIGSGKTTVCLLFQQLYSIPVYFADVRAKHLVEQDEHVKTQIIHLLGNEAYIDNKYNRSYIASKVFNDKNLLHQLNSIIHPAVFNDAQQFFNKHTNEKYVLYEAAILFESGSYKMMDKTILVVAPTSLRVERTIKRDNISEDLVMQRIKNQKTDEEKLKLCNFAIINDGEHDLKEQVIKLHQTLIKL